MITAVDPHVLLDLLIPGSFEMESAADQLERASGEGKLILNEVVYAELAGHFPTGEELATFMTHTGLEIVPSLPQTLVRAGHSWSQYAKRRKKRLEMYTMGEGSAANMWKMPCPAGRAPTSCGRFPGGRTRRTPSRSIVDAGSQLLPHIFPPPPSRALIH